ncbi:hypothetical protein VNO77_06953 [Canavalia gladiata]|uniref:Uncharacterized protein n=1 Tax=Canavalia gladiata TaxID=3824 RepID=A0AAN9QVW7_CANGL
MSRQIPRPTGKPATFTSRKCEANVPSDTTAHGQASNLHLPQVRAVAANPFTERFTFSNNFYSVRPNQCNSTDALPLKLASDSLKSDLVTSGPHVLALGSTNTKFSTPPSIPFPVGLPLEILQRAFFFDGEIHAEQSHDQQSFSSFPSMELFREPFCS